MRYYLATFIALVLFGVPAVTTHFGPQINQLSYMLSQAGSQLAAVILNHNPKTVSDIQSHYDQSTLQTSSTTTSSVPRKVRILVVPGHEPNYGGAEYKNLKERNITVELADDLSNYLRSNLHYEVFQTREKNNWNNIFVNYFKENWDKIIAWQKAATAETKHLISVGLATKSVSNIVHNVAPKDVAYRLFGITKWANDNDIDITIHIHINDDTEHGYNAPGKHTGFAIYVPDNQYGNGTTTRAVAETIFKKLEKYYPVSDLPGESSGIVNEQNLIAIGSDNTANAASLLIEYGYIYEPQFTNPDTRSLALKNMAYQTYLGLEDFFKVI